MYAIRWKVEKLVRLVRYLRLKTLNFKMSSPQFPENFSLEMVGLEDVRIVNEQQRSVIPAMECPLTLKNLLIYEIGNGIQRHTIHVQSTEADIQDVRIHGTKSFALFFCAQAKVKVVRSTFVDCSSGFGIRRSDATFADCKWKEIDYCSASVNCNLSFSRCSFTDSKLQGVIMMGAVNVRFDGCEFIASPKKVAIQRAIDVSHGVQLNMNECAISGFSTAFEIADFHTNAVIQKTKFVNCSIAFDYRMNASLSVFDCVLDIELLVMYVMTQVRGKAEFRRNVVRSPGAHFNVKNVAAFLSDGDQKFIDHDFELFFFHAVEPEVVPWQGAGATAKSRARFMKSMTKYDAKYPLPEETKVSKWPIEKIKRCSYCFKGPEEKFSYCTKCRIACYCSKACQKAHWKDHKLVCKK